MRWLNGTDLIDMSLSKFWEVVVMDREVCRAAIHGVTKSLKANLRGAVCASNVVLVMFG